MGANRVLVVVVIAVCALFVSSALAGPVIIGGDDLGDHGKFDGAKNIEGWLYIETAIENIFADDNITCDNDGSIAALGSASSMATEDDWGGAINSAASELGKTVAFYNGAAAINQFFTDLANGTKMPAMIWIAGFDPDTANSLDAAEGAALTANAAAIAKFVNSGCGLLMHGCDDVSSFDECDASFDWLSSLIPTLIPFNECQASGAELTPFGQAAFPGLSDSDIDANAGPCHNHFGGNFGTLRVLGIDGQNRPFILGGGKGTVIAASATMAPVMGTLPLAWLAIMLAVGGIWAVRRRLAAARHLDEKAFATPEA
jgi:hypothetical protein